MPKQILLTIFILPLIFTSLSSFAGGHKSGETKHKNKHAYPRTMIHLLKGIEISEEQKNKITELHKKQHDEYKKSIKTQRKAAKEIQSKMNELILADKFDESAVRALAKKMADKQVEKRVNHMQNQHKILSLLTAEQKEKVKENIEKHVNKPKNKMKKKEEAKAADKMQK